ncbi:MAG: HAMP domain-containing sensor histidine kinase, partial [Pseudomonadota bacterium]
AADVRRQLADAGRKTGVRVRIYAADGPPLIDNWQLIGPTYELRDPDMEPWRKDAARFLDRLIEGAVGAEGLPSLDPAQPDVAANFPELATARDTGRIVSALRRAPDRSPVAFAAAPFASGTDRDRTLLVSANARDVTTVVRAERATLGLIFLGVLALSLTLSSFLARTIVRPLRRLAIAAERVRLGRAREVTVPRFQFRGDEIGELARSLSDMTMVLRERIDATEAFAADVAHELKNPLASLRSAIEALPSVKRDDQRSQLLDIITTDVARLDRLITDIAHASRVDAELTRTRFEPVDLGRMTAGLVEAYEARGLPRGIRLAFARPAAGSADVLGDAERLAQVVRNLVDNAISFSPDDGLVEISVAGGADRVRVRVDDDGPGIAAGTEDRIFDRFYSERPEGERFGRHSGLGLAISRAIVEAHSGTLVAENRRTGGARFLASLPRREGRTPGERGQGSRGQDNRSQGAGGPGARRARGGAKG